MRGDNAAYLSMHLGIISEWHDRLRESHPEIANQVIMSMMTIKGLADTINNDVIMKPGE